MNLNVKYQKKYIPCTDQYILTLEKKIQKACTQLLEVKSSTLGIASKRPQLANNQL